VAPLRGVPRYRARSPGGHDDLANAVAGAALLARKPGYDTSLAWIDGSPIDDPSSHDPRRRRGSFAVAEQHSPSVVVDSLKALDPERPIREGREVHPRSCYVADRSMAAMSGAWLRRKVRHPWDGGPRRLTMYFATLD
jgi:hypothetical protein